MFIIFLAALRYRQGVSSWLEQRDFTYTTISALNDHQVVQEISEEFKKLKPGLPDLKGRIAYKPSYNIYFTNY